MSYIGNQPISAAFLTDTFSGTGSATAFTMSVAPANTTSVLVAVTGVLQDPSTYSVSGTTLTFSAAPPSGTSNISVRYLGIPASGVTTTAYRTVTDFTATAGQTSFSTPSYTVGYINVFRNGVRLVSTDFTATTGTTVVLANACTLGDAVVTESFYVSSVLNAIPNTGGSVSASNLAASGTGSSSNFLRGDMAWSSVNSIIQPISASVATNALTITASALNLDFRSTTLGSGTVTTVSGTPANLVISSGSTLGTVSAVASRIVVIALNNAGTIELAAVNISGGNQLDETNLITTTAEGGAGAADSANVIYSTTARTSVAYRVIGFIDSTQATAGTWATAPSTIQGIGGQALAALSSIGYGQTYSAPTRALATTYYNTTGKPITCVIVGSSGAGNFGSLSVSINGATAFIFAQSQNSSGTVACSGTFIIPANASYIVTANNIGLGSWNELR